MYMLIMSYISAAFLLIVLVSGLKYSKYRRIWKNGTKNDELICFEWVNIFGKKKEFNKKQITIRKRIYFWIFMVSLMIFLILFFVMTGVKVYNEQI